MVGRGDIAAREAPPAVFVATCDIAAHTRGRGIPATSEEEVLRSGLGWVPADFAINSFGEIAPDNVFGSRGDLRLMPDPATRTDIPADGATPSLRIYLADLLLPDGTPWPCCPRSFLKRALADLDSELGVSVKAAFEHEFILTGLRPTSPFSLERHRAAEPFGTDLLELLARAGLEPDTWLPEYGRGQFEITVGPALGVAAADRAVLLRDLVRDLARRRGHTATFSPLPDPEGIGNGVHLHFSLVKDDGTNVLAEPGEGALVSDLGRRFAAGIIEHAPAITALTAPSPVSFMRLTPHRWSSAGAFLADRNREAMLRICAVNSLSSVPAARQLNLEFRATDATANPWLALGVLVRAGLTAVREGYPPAEVLPETATDADLASVPPLPESLEAALTALEKDEVVRSWFHPDLLATHLAVKRYELHTVAGLDRGARCQRVADVY